MTALTFTPDGKHMATAAYDRSARLWDLSTGKTIAKFTVSPGATDLAFTADGKTLAIACTDQSLRLFDVSSGKKTMQIDLGSSFHQANFAIAPDGKALYVSSGETVLHGFDTATGKELYPTVGHLGGVAALVWSPDGKILATTGSGDMSILLWDAASGKMIRRCVVDEAALTTQLQFSADGKSLLSYSNDRTLRVWDVAEGKERQSFMTTPVQAGSFAFSPNGKLAAAQGVDRVTRIWDIAAEKELHHLGEAIALPQRTYYLTYLLFAADNRTLLAYSPNERTLRRWDAAAGKELAETKGMTLPYTAFAPAGDGWSSVYSQGMTTSLLELATGKARLTLTIPTAAPAPGGAAVHHHHRGRLVAGWPHRRHPLG